MLGKTIQCSLHFSISAIGSTLLKLLYLARQTALTCELPTAKHKILTIPIGVTLALILALPFIFHDIPSKTLPSWQNIIALTWPISLGLLAWMLLRKVNVGNHILERFSQFSDYCKGFFQRQGKQQNKANSQTAASFFAKTTEYNYINICLNKNRTVVTWRNKLLSWHINQSIIIVGLAITLAATLYWG